MTEETHIGEIIRYFRKRKKLTQAQLADGICSTVYLRYLENGKREPTVHIISEFSTKLKINLFEFHEGAKRFGNLHSYLLFIQCNLNFNNLKKFRKLLDDNRNQRIFETNDGKQLLFLEKYMTSNLFMEKQHYALEAFRLHFPSFDFDHFELIPFFSGLEQTLYIRMASLFSEYDERHDLGIQMLEHFRDYCFDYLQYEYIDARKNTRFLERCCFCMNAIISDAIAHNIEKDLLQEFEKALSFCQKHNIANCISDLYANRGIYYYDVLQDYNLAKKDFAYAISMAETFWNERQITLLKAEIKKYPLAIPFNL